MRRLADDKMTKSKAGDKKDVTKLLNEAAAALTRSPRWVRERVSRGELPVIRLDGAKEPLSQSILKELNVTARGMPNTDAAERPTFARGSRTLRCAPELESILPRLASFQPTPISRCDQGGAG